MVTLTEFSPLLLPLEPELLQRLFLLLSLSIQLEAHPGADGIVMGSLETGRGYVAAIHHLGDVVTDVLGSVE